MRSRAWALARDLTITVVGASFSLWVTFASGYQSVYQAMLLLLLGLPLYAFLKARRERLGQVDEPIDMPPELADAVVSDPQRPVALVRRPGPRLDEGLVTHIERRPSTALAHRQWQGYLAALQSTGWDLVEVPPADDCPDAVFVEDTVVVFRNVAVMTRPGAPSRRARSSRSRRSSRHSASRSPRSARRPPSTAATS